ncbi:MAG: LamG domain-containing protein, partial [Winogradskyella sp.]|nr:LamG domain-containing protein [Winogradskyella sp.]
YSGSINGFNNGSTLLIEGNFNPTNNISFNSTNIYIESSGSFTYPVTFAPGGSTVVKNRGSFIINGDFNVSGSASLINYVSAYFEINGDASINNTVKNCGIMYVYGGVTGSGGSGLENYCSLYVQQDISLNGDFTSDGLIIIDGSLDVNGSTFYNNDVLILTNLNLTNDHIVGNDQTSLLIVRQHSELSNGSSITGHLFYDEDDGGGFDTVCGSCTEEVDIVFDINMPTATEEIMTNCGADIIVNPFIEESKLDFDGIDDYVSTSSIIDGLDSITLMAWVKYDITGTTMTIAGEDRACRIELYNGNKPRATFRTQGFVQINVTAPSTIPANEWHHIATTYTNSTGDINLFVDGELVRTASSSATATPLTVTSESNGNFEVGRRSSNITNQEYFKGDIDEVRLFDKVLTESQIQKIVYQEIGNNGGNIQGAIIDKDIEDDGSGLKVAWSNLIGYYPMTDIKNNTTSDYSANDNKLELHNITNIQPQTAPMPYETTTDGDWSSESTWLYGDVWDIENAASNKAWSIVKIANNVTTSSSHENLGLVIEPGAKLTVNGDQLIKNNWYLNLGGVLDLKDDAQLIQTSKSDLVTSATGRVLRRQEGNSSYFWYNYWSSPVGTTAATTLSDNNGPANNANNTDYRLDLIKDESETLFQFTNSLHEVGKISTYWLYSYKNGLTYYDWAYVAPSTALEPGVGYTQKGTGTTNPEQQYIFEGKPNNGTILVNVTDVGGPGSTPSVSKTDYLLGNPYPSALDIHKFIDDNVGVIDGTLNLWQQWSGSSHNLSQYNGGYAQVNKLGSVRAYQFVGLEGAHNGSQDGITTPSRYLPVGQGFMAEIIADGTVEFNNDQRIFIKEADADGTYNNGSAFFRSAATTTSATEEENIFQKIRLELNSVNGPATRRELLLGFSDATTDAYDYGYEALNTESGANDLNLALDGDNYTMQAYSPITEDKEIPLNFKSSGDYFYEIKITETENVPEDQDIYIRDTYTE